MTFSEVNFYKTAVDPLLADLTAVNFPGLSKTLLATIPDFTLFYGGPDLTFNIPASTSESS